MFTFKQKPYWQLWTNFFYGSGTKQNKYLLRNSNKVMCKLYSSLRDIYYFWAMTVIGLLHLVCKGCVLWKSFSRNITVYESAGEFYPPRKSIGIMGFPALKPSYSLSFWARLFHLLMFVTCEWRAANMSTVLKAPQGRGCDSAAFFLETHCPAMGSKSFHSNITTHRRGTEGKRATYRANEELLIPGTRWLLEPSSSYKLPWRYLLFTWC